MSAIRCSDDALVGHVAFGSARALGPVVRHGLAFLADARAAGALVVYRIALVRNDGEMLGGTEDAVGGKAKAR